MAFVIDADTNPTLADILAPGLDLLVCGYNPATYAVGRAHYYARPANRFWEDLHEAGFTPRPLRGPDEDLLLPAWGLGLTDLVKRHSPNIDDLAPADYAHGCTRLDALLAAWRPRILCFNGLGLLPAYRRHGRPPAGLIVRCVPSTSPRNQRLKAERLEAFKALRDQVPPREALAPRPARPADRPAMLDLAARAGQPPPPPITPHTAWVLDSPHAQPGEQAPLVAAYASPLPAGPGWLAVDPAAPEAVADQLIRHAQAVARALMATY